MSDIISLGLWIKRRRKALDLTQDALAALVGCSKDLIAKIEGDARRPSREIATLLASHLQLAADERAQFIQVARAELGADRLAPPAQSVAGGAFVPAQAVASAADTAGQRHTTPPTNLPTPPTALIGRAREIAQICALLRTPAARLITLSGPGGIGKTRLGQQVAAELLDDFGDGVYFVDLAPIREPMLVISAIAQTLGIRETGGQPLVSQLKQFLGDKRMLLLLDNFEQVLDAAPLLADLLATASRLKLLITSREMLHLRGEKEVVVPPLALPDRADLPPLEELSQYAAVALFMERALDVRPDFQLTNANAAAVAEICVRLDGLPLAIELAATRSKLFTPEALLARLSSRLRVLTGGARDLPARQQTIRATLDWSYDLLEAHEQALFRRLGVFVGGCTLAAAEAVCDRVEEEAGDLAVVDGLQRLVDKSLLQHRDRATSNGEAERRFTMLELVREYAYEQLAVSGEAAALQRRHAEHYLGLAEAAEDDLKRASGLVSWFERLEAEHDNLRAALEWALSPERTRQEAQFALRLASVLREFWLRRGHQSEGRRRLEAALAACAHGRAVAPALWAKALLATGAVVHSQGDVRRGAALSEEALAMFRELGDKPGIATALADLALSSIYQSDFRRAAALYEEQLALERELGNRRGIASALGQLGYIACDQGDAERGFALLEESLVMLRELGDRAAVAWALHSLGVAAYHQGDFPRAVAWSEESLALFQELGDVARIASMLIHLGSSAGYQGDVERASRLLQEGVELFRKLGDMIHVAIALRYQGKVAHDQGDWACATALYQESLTLARGLGRQWEIAACLEGLAGVAGGQDRPRRAARLWGAAEAIRERIAAPLPSADRARYAAAVAGARARLGDQAFDAAWAEGRVLPLEQAIAYALSDGAGSAEPPETGSAARET